MNGKSLPETARRWRCPDTALRILRILRKRYVFPCCCSLRACWWRRSATRGGQLTVTTLNAWRAGQNLPSYPKLRQFCRAANIEPVDFHLELDAFMRRICDANGISEEERRIHAARFRSFLYSGLRFRAFDACSPAESSRLFERLRGGISGVQSCPQQPRRGACVADTLRESGTSVCHDALLFHAGRILH